MSAHATTGGRRRLFLPLYLLVMLSYLVGGSLVGFFENYARTDFAGIAVFVQSNSELFGVIDPDDERAVAARELAFEQRIEQGLIPDFADGGGDAGGSRLGLLLVATWVGLVIWLLPVYRQRPGDPVSEVVERRVLLLPRVVLLAPWILGALDALIKLATLRGQGALSGGAVVVYLTSFLMFGALVGQFNVSVTLTYITQRIAEYVFRGDARFRRKQARTISLAGRFQLSMLTLAMLPVLLSVAVPLLFNWWIIDEARTSGEIDFLRIAQAFAPVLVVATLGIYFLVAQVISVFSFRRAVQRPLDTLISRMRQVAQGDLSTRSSVLSGDEIGALKGHFNTMVEGLEEREKIRDTFGRYVSMEIAEKLMAGGAIDLAGEEIETTVMFADIRNFTAFSEQLPPRELVTFLNEYFSYVVRPIVAHRGVVNKFIGDSVMAVFSPVFGVDDHAEAALRAAIGMREALSAFNATGSYAEIRQGIGVHTGVLVAGTVGAEDRREYTVIGDTVNVASRIESQTKVVNTDILISGDSASRIDTDLCSAAGLTEVEPVTMRGKSTPTRLFVVGAST